jgi:PAS domain S-box-containing protein
VSVGYMFRSIRLKLTLFIILLLILTTVAFSLVTVKILNNTILNEIAKRAETLSQSSAAAAAYSLISGDALGMDHLVFKGKSSSTDIEYIAIVDKKMKVVAHSDIKKRGEVLKESEGLTLRKNADGTVLREIALPSGKIFEIYTPILFQEKLLGGVLVGMNQSVLMNAQRLARGQIIWLFAATLFVAVLGVFGLSVFITKPIKELASGVEELKQGRWDRPLRVHSMDELGRLTESFNRMSKIILEQQEELARYISDLRNEKQRFQTLSENAPFGMAMMDKEGGFRYLNPKFRELFNYDLNDIPDKRTWLQKAYPDLKYREKVLSTWMSDFEKHGTGGNGFRTFNVACKDRSEKIVNFMLVQLNTGENLMACVDITEQKKTEIEMATLQEQVRQSQKMEAVGRLAGGVAHDFNNLLTVIKGYSQISLIELEEDMPLKENIEGIKEAADRAADLTRQLLAFSRRQVMEMKVLDLNPILKNMDKMLRRLLGEDIELLIHLAEDLGRVKVDVGQMEQVVMNLAVNARDAMPSGGRLTIETANAELDDTYTRSHDGVIPGQYVLVSVSDTGMGMTPEVQERIFEPFFTTKEKGKGTGLGLSTVYGIVKQSGGNIWVYSEPGKGTTFKIYLPLMDGPKEETKEKKLIKENLPLGNETILVVEDEGEVRKLAVKILKGQGYRVLEASRGDEALQIQEKNNGPIDLILVDVVMPGMSGSDLVKRFSPLHPETKILYMSGYTDDAVIHHGVLAEGVNYLQKPFTIEGVTRKVREVMDSLLYDERIDGTDSYFAFSRFLD